MLQEDYFLPKMVPRELHPVYSKIIKLYAKCKSPYKLYCGITREAASLVKAEKCSLMLQDSESQVLRVSAIIGADGLLIEKVQVRAGEGIAGRVYEVGEPILIDCEVGIRKYVSSPRPRYKTACSMSVPLGLAHEVIGVLNLSDKRSGEPFTEKDLAILSAFALFIFFILKLSLCYSESERMRELSTTDFLTGLFNRRYFDIRLEEEHQRVRRSGGWFSLAMLDIDNFKLFNDTEGHLAGDEILKKIASVIGHTIRTNDILARFGGEEFVIIMPQTSEATAFKVAERIRNDVKNLIRTGWKRFPMKKITVCIGISAYYDCREPIESVVNRADMALAKAKYQGKDCTVLYSDYLSKSPGTISPKKMRNGEMGPS